jgi:hypothetical protein
MGSGTSLVESVLLGRDYCIGADTNPLACLIAKVKLTPIKNLSEVDIVLKKLEISENKEINFALKFLKDNGYSYTRKWFNEDVLRECLLLFYRIGFIKDEAIRNLALVSMASIVKVVANIDPRCTHHLVTKRKKNEVVYPVLCNEIRKNIRLIESLNRKLGWNKPRIIHESAANLSSIETHAIDFLISHPPYLGTILYSNIHRLSTELLFHFSQEFKKHLKIDFNYNSAKLRDISSDNEKEYLKMMNNVINEAARVVKGSGRIAFIMGDGRSKGFIRHPFTDVIEMMKNKNWCLEEMFIWVLNNNGGMHVKRRGHHIDHNYIMVFRYKK